MEYFMKYFFTTFFSFYVYMKLLNLKVKVKRNIIVYLCSSLILSSIITLVNLPLPYIGLISINILFVIIITLNTKTEFRISIITSIIASGISNSVYVFSIIISGIAFTLIGFDSNANNLFLPLLSAAFIEGIILVTLFHTRRLRNGMPFLTEYTADNIGITISLLILFCIAMLVGNDTNNMYLFPTALILVCAASIIIWWQKWLTRTYINRKRDAELIELRKTMKERDEYIERLKQQNISLGKLIHKDNKLIPAMELAVTDFLKNYAAKDPEELKTAAQDILANLKQQSASRRDILDALDAEVKQLPRTGLTSLDTLLAYLAAKAAKSHVTLDLTVHANIKYLTQSIIDVNDLNTLFAELVDNSIISAQQNEVKKVLITIELIDNLYVISVFDSGDRFASAVLENIGIKSITTRGDTGGSGTGLVNITEVTKKYKISFIIDELFAPNSIFTKKISVRFDHKHKYILRSNRTDISQILSNRPDITLDINPS